jgi:hypothetical protein
MSRELFGRMTCIFEGIHRCRFTELRTTGKKLRFFGYKSVILGIQLENLAK